MKIENQLLKSTRFVLPVWPAEVNSFHYIAYYVYNTVLRKSGHIRNKWILRGPLCNSFSEKRQARDVMFFRNDKAIIVETPVIQYY